MDAEAPAAKAIRLLKAKRIAHVCDLTTDAVWKWAKRNGGFVPSQHQPAILKLAQDLDVELTAADLVGRAA